MVQNMDFNNFKPCLLIAMPKLSDPFFHKTVVFLTDFLEDGATGFILNKLSYSLDCTKIELPEGKINKKYNSYPIWFGGPVDPDHIWMIYNQDHYPHQEAGMILSDNIAIAQNTDILRDAENLIPQDAIKIIHGYSGWDKEQLEEEILNSYWITADLNYDMIFKSNPEELWDDAIKALGINPNQLLDVDSEYKN